MPKATGAQAGVAYIEESVLGTTPATPSLIEVASTGFTPEITKDGAASADIRSDRMISDFRHGFLSATFGLNFTFKHGEFDAFLESALFGAWAANVLKAGTTRKSFSIEAGYKDISQYFLYTGCVVNNMTLSLSAEAAEVTGAFNMVGMNAVRSATSADADGWTPPGAKRAFDNFTGSILEDAAPIALITGLELSLENGISPARTLFQRSAADLFHGRSNLTGTVSAYFEDGALVDKFIDETPTSLQFTLEDPDGNTMQFLIPRVVYTGGSPPAVDGEGGLILSMPFQAVYDQTAQTNLQITRSV